MHGLIAFFFACFSAGTPKEDAYNRLLRMRSGQEPGPALELTPWPFVSYLPQRMLRQPRRPRGALAVIGHIEQGVAELVPVGRRGQWHASAPDSGLREHAEIVVGRLSGGCGRRVPQRAAC